MSLSRTGHKDGDLQRGVDTMSSVSPVRIAGLSLVLLGCGPAVSTTGTNGSETTSASTSTANTGDATAGSSTPLPPATVTPTSASTTGAASSSGTGQPQPSTSSADESTGLPPIPGALDFKDNVSCDIWDPVCPELEKCIAWSNDGSEIWNDTRCTAVGTREVGEACSVQGGPTAGIDNCVLGTMCWGVDPETNDGYCVAQCRGSENAPVCDDPTTACVMGNDGSINLCPPTCDPVSQNCPEDEACYGDPETHSTVCLRPGTPLLSGPDLLTPALCPPGSTAVAPEQDVDCEDGEPCCALWCDLDLVPSECPLDKDCHLWIEEGSVIGGYNEPGICLNVQ